MHIKRIIGIDPGSGKNSGLSYLELEFGLWSLKHVGMYDAKDLATYIDKGPHKDLVVCLEKAQASPQMGVVSAFTYGVSYGVILGEVERLVKQHSLFGSFVSPVTWKTQFNLLKKPKSASVKLVRQMFKDSGPEVLKNLTPHAADSVLIGLSRVK